MRRIHLTTHASSRRGQALMVAVLLMMAILLVGILFVALVTYNQDQSTRHEDTLLAQAMAEAAVRYASYMLENSPEGADWRPPEPPAVDSAGNADLDVYGADRAQGTEDDYYDDVALGRGWAPVLNDLTTRDSYTQRGFSRFPDTRNPSGVTSATVPTAVDRGYFMLRVSYNPWEPGDTATPDPMNWHLKIEAIGRVEGSQVYRKLVAYKPIPMLNYARLVHNLTDDGRPAYFGIPAFADMDRDTAVVTSGTLRPDWLATLIDGPVHVNGRLDVAGGDWPDGSGGILDASTTFALTDGFSPAGYLRSDKIEATGGIYRWQEPADTVDDTGDRPAQVDLNGTVDMMTYTSDDVDPDADSFDTIGGHVLDNQQGLAGGESRFVSWVNPGALTLGGGTTNFERYTRLARDTGELVQAGVGAPFENNGQWGFGKGIYIDNFGDVQFNHDIDTLIADWQRPAATAGTPPPDSGWNALFTTYAPPAVEIEFLPTEAAAGSFEVSTNPTDVGSGEVWWPYHQNGQPGIRITRHDETWRIPEGANAGQLSGQRTIVFDYPTPMLDGSDDTVRHPLIVTEGNVRVSGQLPPALNTVGDLTRAYDMIVVSGGTVYIDGQLLAPNDYLVTAVSDEFNTKVALLARDCVCLNATQIVPQDTIGTAPAVPDDPLNPADPNKHWELAPGSDGRGYSMFMWGADPVGDSVALVARQTAADPGPSGVQVMPWTASGGYTSYDFGTAPAPMVDTTFALVPPATVFPDGTSLPPQPYGVVANAPQWAPYRDAAALLPWDLAGYMDPTPGLANAIVLRQADPAIGAGSTSYWLKHWKIAEYDSDGLPVGAISARVNAAVYAERGCWYVLSPGYFDPNLAVDPVAGVAVGDVIENRRYNYKLTFVGTIAENFTATVEAAQGWHDRLAFPETYDSGDLEEWGTVEYQFDETLRLARFHSTVSNPMNPAANQPRLPLLPVSPDLVYYGE